MNDAGMTKVSQKLVSFLFDYYSITWSNDVLHSQLQVSPGSSLHDVLCLHISNSRIPAPQ